MCATILNVHWFILKFFLRCIESTIHPCICFHCPAWFSSFPAVQAEACYHSFIQISEMNHASKDTISRMDPSLAFCFCCLTWILKHEYFQPLIFMADCNQVLTVTYCTEDCSMMFSQSASLTLPYNLSLSVSDMSELINVWTSLLTCYYTCVLNVLLEQNVNNKMNCAHIIFFIICEEH